MKKLMSLAVIGAVLAMTAAASAQAPPAPAPEGEEAARPVPVPEPAGLLYECVEYKDLDEMAPCAVPKIIEVPRPRDPCCKPAACGCARPAARACCKPAPPKCCAPAASACGKPATCCCPPQCVKIKICVPPCGCLTVKVNKDGDKICYDYGEYEIDIRIKKDHIEVEYED